ncbi:MAG TPA: hypothetical protein VJ777_13515 [Mycobacterium sp.]|nr:hypothetical protein [Mycobacterium sp.]
MIKTGSVVELIDEDNTPMAGYRYKVLARYTERGQKRCELQQINDDTGNLIGVVFWAPLDDVRKAR